MTDRIFCPVCQTELVVTHQERYQSLAEHVSDPNREPSMKNGYQCPDSSCASHIVGATWTNDGELFTDTPDHLDYHEAQKFFKQACLDNIVTAIGSWQRGYDLTEKKRKKYTFSINLYWIILKIEPSYSQIFDEDDTIKESLGYAMKEKYKWKFYKINFTWFKRDKSNGYFTSFSPIWQIIKFKNDSFKRNYHKALQKDASSLTKVMKIYNDNAYYSNTQKEDRYWYLVANKILRFWYKKELNILKNITQ